MSGTELGQELRRVDPDAKILYFTGFSDRLFSETTTLGAHEAFVEKPLTMQWAARGRGAAAARRSAPHAQRAPLRPLRLTRRAGVD